MMDLDAALAMLGQDPNAGLDLAELALEVARDEYPDLDVEAYLGEVKSMAHEARAYLRGDLAARVNGLCRYLFHEMGFRGNQHEYHDPRNSYLNQVLDRRTGIPITLAAVAMAVAARAGLPVTGVGLPGHFIAKVIEGHQQVLFDPFHGGRFLTIEDCGRLVEQVTGAPFEATPMHLAGVSLGAMVRRMLTNLKVVYLTTRDFPRALRTMGRLCQLNPHDMLNRRDLGLTFVQMNEPGKAIDHLATYLASDPPEADKVRHLLQSARSTIAGWN
jgi:regulator of sirC expression with transglutaminase-like and TPR domain